MRIPSTKKQLLQQLDELLPEDLDCQVVGFIWMAAEYLASAKRLVSQTATNDKGEIRTRLDVPRNRRFLLVFEPEDYE